MKKDEGGRMTDVYHSSVILGSGENVQQIAVRERPYGRARREHLHLTVWSRDWIAVAREAPGVDLVAMHQIGCVAGRQQDKCAVWERIQLIDGCQLHLVALIVM